MKLIFSISHIERSIELNFSKKTHIIVIHKNINVITIGVIGKLEQVTNCRNIRSKSNHFEFESRKPKLRAKPPLRHRPTNSLIIK